MRYFEKQAKTALVKQYLKGTFTEDAVGSLVKQMTSKGLEHKPRLLRPLGQGSEGVADLVTHPEAGIAVQKTFNVDGPLFSKEVFDKKLEIGMKADHPNLAKTYGRKDGKPVMYNEYVNGTKPDFPKSKGEFTRFKRTISSVRKHLKEKWLTGGISDIDLSHNILKAKDGTPKIIDFLPSEATRTTDSGSVNKMIKTKYGFNEKRRKRLIFWEDPIAEKIQSDVMKHTERYMDMPSRIDILKKVYSK